MKQWHVHVYFRNEEEQSKALVLRQQFEDRVSWYTKVVAFHPYPMWVLTYQGELPDLVNKIYSNRNGITVFVHPVLPDKDAFIKEHIQDGIWFGQPYPFDIPMLIKQI